MKYAFGLAALAAVTIASPTPTENDKPLKARAACASAVTLASGSNPFKGRKLHANSYYASEIDAAIEQMSDASLKAAAAKVKDVGSFLWLDTIERAPLIADTLPKIPCTDIGAFVVYDLPGRDCAAKASNGELAVGEISRYKTEYIDVIAAAIKANPNTAIALVIEPDSLPNLVTNANLTTCQNSKAGYEEGVAYALKTLNFPNVAMYVDAGHGGWLGWNDNLKPGAAGLAKVYKAAGSPKQVFGVASNVAGWNAWDLSPGEFSKATDAQWNKCQNEKTYASTFGAALKSAGHPSKFIIDTGRNAVQGLRKEWGNWCNVNGAGFGVRPTDSTGDTNVDAFVWVKPGGESDGTSDTSANRYDSFCGKEDAFKPAPEAGTWNQAYFEMLLKNAKPQF